MPIYEYICDDCDYELEKVQKVGSDAPICPDCGGAMHKKFSPIAMFKMKGMGGYPSLRKAYQAGGRNLVEDAEKSKNWV